LNRILLTALVLLPQAAYAAEPLGDTGSDFTYEKLVRIVTGLVNIFLEIAGIAAVMAIVYYGFRMVISRGDAGAFTAAKKGLGLAVVGAIVIFGVYTIIATVYQGVRSVGN